MVGWYKHCIVLNCRCYSWVAPLFPQLSGHLLLISGSSSIKIEDDKTGTPYTVNSHDISSGWKYHWHKSLVLLLVTMVCGNLIR
jgi:hypothetical protein